MYSEGYVAGVHAQSPLLTEIRRGLVLSLLKWCGSCSIHV